MVRPVLKGGRYLAAILYRTVDDPSTDSIISWSQDGKSFIIWDVKEFCRLVIFNFGLTKFELLAYRLKTFGFRKVESEHELEYANDDFVRGKPELTVDIEVKRLKSYLGIPMSSFEGFPPQIAVTPEKKIADLMVYKASLMAAKKKKHKAIPMDTKDKEKAIAKDTKGKDKAIAKDLSKLTI